jgi:hypothetical protein
VSDGSNGQNLCNKFRAIDFQIAELSVLSAQREPFMREEFNLISAFEILPLSHFRKNAAYYKINFH